MVYLERIGFPEEIKDTGIGPILASTRCDFRKPLNFPDTVSVGTRVGALEADRFVSHYRVVSHKLKKVVADGEGLVVSFHYRKGKRADIPVKIRRAIETLEPQRHS
jgi:acyl-CoA thioester hydrolase